MTTPLSSPTRTGVGARIARLPMAPWAWQGAMILLAIVVTLYYTTKTGRDFWYDESMLVEAVRLDGWLAPWQPMSHFEQASPWGVYLIQKASLDLIGFQPALLRVPGFVAYAIGGIAVWRAASLWFGGVAALFAGTAALVSADVVQTAGDFKHYIYEFAVAGVLLWLAARLLRRSTRRRLVVLLIGSLVAVPFSNTVVFVVPGMALACALVIPEHRRVLIAGTAVFFTGYGGWYLACVRPSTVFQLAYPTYKQLSNVDVYSGLVQGVVQPGGGYFISITAMATVGLAIATLWNRAMIAPFLPALVAVVLGWIGVRLGVVPFSADRHVLFLVPLVALAVGASVASFAQVLRRAVPTLPHPCSAVSMVLGLVLVLGATATIAPSAGIVRQQTGQALAASRGTCTSYFVDWWSQPMTTLYAEALGIRDRVHGTVSTRSGVGEQAWIYRVMGSPQQYQSRLLAWMTAHPSTCLVTVGGANEQELVFRPLMAAGFTCQSLSAPTGIFLNRCAAERA